MVNSKLHVNSSEKKYVDLWFCYIIAGLILNQLLTRAVLVACVFRVVLAGGGVFTPPLTRLLGHVATRSKRQSKERQK